MKTLCCAIGLSVLFITASADAALETQIIDFEDFTHGRIIDGQFDNVDTTIDNYHTEADLGVIFDSRERLTADYDLEGPRYVEQTTEGSWSGGNIDISEVLGNLLIIQESSGGCEAIDPCDDGFVLEPNDEGSRPAGSITFQFHQPIIEFGFDLIDLDGLVEMNNGGGYYMILYDDQAPITTINFQDLITPSSDYYDDTIIFGDNTANRLSPITAGELGVDHFSRVQIVLGGSGAIDNILYTAVPEPGSIAMVFAGVMMILLPHRRSERKSY